MFEIGDYVKIENSNGREGTVVAYIPPDIKPLEEDMIKYFGDKLPKTLLKPVAVYRLIISKPNTKDHILYPLTILNAKRLIKHGGA